MEKEDKKMVEEVEVKKEVEVKRRKRRWRKGE